MNTQKYLDRIHYDGNTDHSIETLKALHRQHVYTVPFENLDIPNRVKIIMDADKLFKKVVENNRGGFCFELNVLFSALLQRLNFQIHSISCCVFSPVTQAFTPFYGHLALIATLEDQWLVDVGFGDAFHEPIKIVFDEPQYQNGTCYRIRKLDASEMAVERSRNEEKFTPMYKFALTPRPLHSFEDMCEFHQTSPLAPFTKGKLCSLATPTGRITLTHNTFTITENGQKREVLVTDDTDFHEMLFANFGMRL